MIVDVQGLRELARLAQDLAGQARAAGDEVSTADGVVWKSTRAQQYRTDLADEARGVQGTADELQRAADALRRHADDVQARLDQLASLQHWFMGELGSARSTLADAAGAVAGAADAANDAAVAAAQRLVDAARSLPTPGSLDWGAFVRPFR